MRKRVRAALLPVGALLLTVGPAAADVAPDLRPVTWVQCQSGNTAVSAITVGGTAQPLIGTAANITFPIRGLLVYNPSSAALQGIATAESMFFDATGTAAAGAQSLEVAAGTGPSFGQWTIPRSNPSVVAATTGHKFTCWVAQ